jgi:hypothetical protein
MTLLFQVGGVFPNLTQNLQNMGFFLYLFPFLLALAIFYGILYWVFASGDKPKIPRSAIALISIILAFFVMLYSSWNTMIVQFMANLSGAGLIVGSGILFVAILLGLVGFNIEGLTGEAAGRGKWVFIIGVLVIGILIFFAAGGGSFGLIPEWSNNGEFLTALFVIAIIGLAVWWLGNEGGGGPKPAGPPKT